MSDERKDLSAELAAVGNDTGSSESVSASGTYSGSYNANPFRESYERATRENLVLKEALVALLYCGGMSRDQTPCPVCLWPLPADIDHKICECCGIHHSYNNLKAYEWDQEFWFRDEPSTPKIIKRLYGRIADLERRAEAVEPATEVSSTPAASEAQKESV